MRMVKGLASVSAFHWGMGMELVTQSERLLEER
jgi:hypothetical protein